MGDWAQYRVDLDLPSIAADQTVLLELTTTQPDNGQICLT